MKTAVWAYSIAVGVASWLVGALGHMFPFIFRNAWGNRPLPPITVFFLQIGWWAFVVAVPFFGAALYLSTRSRMTPDRVLMFASLATLAIVGLLAFAIVSLTIPFVPIIHLHR